MKKWKTIIILVGIIVGITGVIITRNSEEEIIEKIETSETKIVLYFSNLASGELVKEYRYVNLGDIKNDMPKTIIDELLKGPNNEELVSAIPNGTKLNSILLENGKIIIDFSNEFAENSEDELKNLHKIYSVVNSLTEITEVNEVEIKVNGEVITSKIRL